MTRLKAVAIVSMLALFGCGGAASADIFTGFYDFADTQYADDFTEVRRGSQITGGGVDLGGTGHNALNFTGQAGPAGDTWLTKWTPGGTPVTFNGRCGTSVAGLILTHPFDNRKGAGLVALLNDTNPGDKGLALVLYDNGNTDAMQLATIDPFTGKLTPLKTMPLSARIKENSWYVVFMDLTVDLAYDGDTLTAAVTVLSLLDPTDPNSDFERPVGGMRFKGPLGPTGLQTEGQVGIMAAATSAVIDSSVTYWAASENFEGPCE